MPLKKLFVHKDPFIDNEFDNIVRNAQSIDFKIVTKKPQDTEGVDGEIRLYIPSQTHHALIYKYRGKWYEIDLSLIVGLAETLIAITDHDVLKNVRHYTKASDGDGHIRKSDGESWEEHRLTKGNPHETQNYQTFKIDTEANRPDNPHKFQFFGNLTTGQLEMWNGEKWVIVA